MKKSCLIRSLAVLCSAILFFNCTSTPKKENGIFENSPGEKANSEMEGVSGDTTSPENNFFGPFYWRMKDEICYKHLKQWEDGHTVDGNIMIAGLKLKNDGIKPKYDTYGHLEELTIEFTNFSIHPENNYTEEELLEIKRLCLRHNKKIKHLIDVFSEKYGDPVQDDFDEDSDDMYLSNGMKKITQWQNDIVKIALCIDNKIPSEAKNGCNVKMWIHFEK